MPPDRRGSDYREPYSGPSWKISSNRDRDHGYNCNNSYRPSSSSFSPSYRRNSSGYGDRYEGSSTASSYSPTTTSAIDDSSDARARSSPSAATTKSPTRLVVPMASRTIWGLGFGMDCGTGNGKAPPKAPRGPRAMTMQLETKNNAPSEPSALRALAIAQDLVKKHAPPQPTTEAPPIPRDPTPPPLRPNEVNVLSDNLLLGMILDHLDAKSLYQCLRVSKAWFERTASIVWKTLNDVEPLFTLLPHAGDLQQLDLRRLQKTIDNASTVRTWERFKVYAARLRTLECVLDGGMVLPIPWKFFSSNPGPLFKSLESVIITDARTADHDTLRFFLSQTSRLRVFEIAYDDDGSDVTHENLRKFWDEIQAFTPLVEKLQISGGFREDFDLDARTPVAASRKARLDRVIGACPNLREFSFGPLSHDEFFCDPSDMFSSAAYHRKLEKLRLEYPGTVNPRWHEFAASDGSIAFQTLKVLEITTTLADLEQFFSKPRVLSRLEELTIWFDSGKKTESSMSHLKSFFEAFASHRETFRSLIFDNRGYPLSKDEILESPMSMSASYETLKPLEEISGLETFVFKDEHPIDITDRELLSLVQTHPHLRTLTLGSTVFASEQRRERRLSANVFPLLAEALPELEELSLRIDTNMPYHVPSKKCACWKMFSKFKRLRKLDLGCSPILDQTKLYRLLAHILPVSFHTVLVEGGDVRIRENENSAFSFDELEAMWMGCKTVLGGNLEGTDGRNRHSGSGKYLDQLLESPTGSANLSATALANLDASNDASQMLEKWKSRAMRTHANLKHTKAEKKAVEEKLRQLESELTDANATLKGFHDTIVEMDGKNNKELQERIEDKETEISKLRWDVMRAKNEAQQANEQLMATKAKMHVQTSPGRISASSDTVRILESKVATLQAELDKWNSQNGRQRQREILNSQFEMLNLRTQGSVPVSVYDREIMARDEIASTLRSELVDAKVLLEKAQEDLATSLTMTAKLETDLREEREKRTVVVKNTEECTALRKELEALREARTREERMAQLTREETRLEKERADTLAKQLEEEKAKTIESKEQLEKAQAQATVADAAADTLRLEYELKLGAHRQKEKEMKKQLRDARVELANRPQPSTVPAPSNANASSSSSSNGVGAGGRQRIAALTSLVGQQSERISELEETVTLLKTKLFRQSEQALARGYKLS